MSFKQKIPNFITFIRILLIPAFVLVFFNISPLMALIVFIFACLSDLLDGYLARKFNAISNFGKLFDPLADKLMQLSALACLFIDSRVSLPILIILIVKELYMMLGAMFVLKRMNKVVFSDLLGKIASFVLDLGLGLAFIHEYVNPYDTVVLYIGVALTLAAMVNYTVAVLKKGNKKTDEEK